MSLILYRQWDKNVKKYIQHLLHAFYLDDDILGPYFTYVHALYNLYFTI